MKLARLTLDGGGEITVNPDHVSHLEPRIGADVTLLFLNTDNIPTVIEGSYVDVVAQLNEATEDGTITELQTWNEQSSRIAIDLIREIRRLQWAFGCAALAFFILLLVIVGRSH